MKNISRCLVLGGALACCVTALAAEPRWQDTFCVEAQQVLAGTQLTAQLQVHTELDSFVESKAGDTPFTVHQYLSNPAPDSALPRTLSCKMRTAERINATQPGAADGPLAAGDTDCVAVHRHMLAKVLAAISPEERAAEPVAIRFEDDNTTFIGPRWLQPWPFDAVAPGGAGAFTLRARALYAPHAWWIPMPARFKGNYYCHLVAPDYLETLLRDSGGEGG